jgi:hypothetical protein
MVSPAGLQWGGRERMGSRAVHDPPNTGLGASVPVTQGHILHNRQQPNYTLPLRFSYNAVDYSVTAEGRASDVSDRFSRGRSRPRPRAARGSRRAGARWCGCSRMSLRRRRRGRAPRTRPPRGLGRPRQGRCPRPGRYRGWWHRAASQFRPPREGVEQAFTPIEAGSRCRVARKALRARSSWAHVCAAAASAPDRANIRRAPEASANAATCSRGNVERVPTTSASGRPRRRLVPRQPVSALSSAAPRPVSGGPGLSRCAFP